MGMGTAPAPERGSGLSVLWRLAAALVLGALIGKYSTATNPTLLDVVIADVTLVLALVLGIALDSAFQRRRAALLWTGLVALVLLVVLPLADLGFQAVQGFPGLDTTTLLGVAFVLAPAVAAFTLGSRRSYGLAIGCALLAWLGLAAHSLGLQYGSGSCRATSGATEFADIACAIAAGLFVVGFGLAALLGLLGGWLRRRLLRSLTPPA